MIVDDEPIARDLLRNYLDRIPGLHLVKSCKNATEAYEGLHEYPVDLIFLDIRMPVITGTEFLRSLRKPPFVIFTTAYPDYAVEGFELNSVDYLLKPITFERFYQAVQKVTDRMANLQSPVMQQSPPDYIFIKQDTRLLRVNYSDIDYIQAEKDFCSIYMGAKKLLAGSHLKILEEQLPAGQFLRVHRSYMVNLDKIRAIKGNVIELNQLEIPIGANYRQALMDALNL
jgi:DNA-binding LytR/AlgR family response regulator